MLLLSILVAAAWSVVVLDVSAYFSHQNEKNNVLKTGDNTSHIEEEFEPPDQVTTDTVYPKKVTVKNDSHTPCYVRVFVEVDQPNLPVSIDFDTKNWTEKQADGYYYYRSILGGREETKPLFTHVTTGGTQSAFRVLIYEETVQAQGYDTAREAFASIKGEQEAEA